MAAGAVIERRHLRRIESDPGAGDPEHPSGGRAGEPSLHGWDLLHAEVFGSDGPWIVLAHGWDRGRRGCHLRGHRRQGRRDGGAFIRSLIGLNRDAATDALATVWPATGSLLLDDLPFRVRNPQTGRTRIAFRIFAAMGYERGRAKLWRLEAFTSKSQSDWEAFLGALDGAPRRVVCDNDHGLMNAVGARFPDTELYLCEWHLRHALERLMGKLRTEVPQHQETINELLPDVEAAFTGPSFWAPCLERAHAAGIPRVSEWLNTTGRIVEDQFNRRGPRASRPADMPLSTSPLDAFINPIRAAIGPRAYGLKNRQRTNRNHHDDVHAYTHLIREWLQGNQGRPGVDRRAVADTRGVPSLR